jgi:hypothetical protein
MENNLKSRNILYWTLPLLALAGCASNQPNLTMAECTFPDSPEQVAPGWVCDEPVAGVELSAIGYAQKSSAGLSFMKQMAVADARVQLAQSFKTHVTNMIKQYAETTGAADSETVDQVNTSVSKLITSETLIGSRLFKSRTSTVGGLYVIVGLDSSNVQKAAEDSINSSMKNDAALWQQFKAKKAQDELAAEITNIKSN